MSRHVRRWGPRDRPSGRSTVGTSSMRRFASAARTTISLANSIPGVASPSSSTLSLRKARIPQWKSPTGIWKNRRPSMDSTGLPR